MIMPPRLRRFTLVVHVTSSVGSLGAVGGFLALAIAGLTSQDAQVVRGVYPAMELITWRVIVPLVVVSLLTGLVSSLGTAWGLLRHYWVLVKFLLTILTTVVLLLQTQPIAYMARVAAEAPFTLDAPHGLGLSLVIHASGGLLVLLTATALAVYKPPGMTCYGWRRQQAQRVPSRP
jgi:hypothetical protein